MRREDKIMNKNESQRIVVVLGAGRSGTSMLTRILETCGLRLSEKMVGSSEQNPEGAYEDTEIYEIQTQIFSRINSSQTLPMPPGWIESEWVDDSIRELSEVVQQRLSSEKGIWGFKDPRTALLLPLWTRVFNRLKVVPLYILSVRNPVAVVSSLNRQYGFGERGSELFWLYKNCEALYQTGGNVFIVHYEDWFSNPEPQAQELMEFVDIRLPEEKILADVLNEVIHKNLNRSIYTEYKITNQWVISLYEVLKGCKGKQFEREQLMDKMMQCRDVIGQFIGWPEEAQKLLKYNGETIEELRKYGRKFKRKLSRADLKITEIRTWSEKGISDLQCKIDSLKNDLNIAQNDLKRLVENNNILQVEKKQICDKYEQKHFQILTSNSYKLGSLIIMAFRHPGKNTILLPFRLIRMVIGAIFFR